jgi:ABC-type branched-subunit amino acid transport system permease subunit
MMPRGTYFLDRYLGNLNGPQELGRTVYFWLGFLAVVILGLCAPLFLGRYGLLNLSNFLISALLGLSLCLIWGFAGILSLGQAAFMGIAGYTYGIIGINLIGSQGNTHLAILGGLLVPVLVAAALGYVMFYARLRGVYVAILMFVITLLCATFMNQTAGPQWAIGIAKLGGNNGLGRSSGDIHEPPNLIFGFGEHTFQFLGRGVSFYYLVFFLLLLTYLGLRWLVNSNFGHVLVAIREDPDRTESFGYNIRFLQLVAFCISALVAGLSGILYVAWGRFITPDVFSVANNILPVIWVAASGRKSLTATLAGSLFLIWLSQWLAIKGNYAFIVLGAILIVTMMLTPEGLITTIAERFARRRRKVGEPSPVGAVETLGETAR